MISRAIKTIYLSNFVNVLHRYSFDF